jgi:uncharacterized protein YnzC (UPF0291/DUF896 family)
MPFKLEFAKAEDAPEALRAHLAEADGKFVFEGEPISVVTQTNEKLKKLRGDLDAKTAKLGRFAKLDELGDELDVDELLSLRELKKQGKPLTADEKAELERLHKKQLDKLNGDVKTRDERLTVAEAELKRYRLTEPLKAIALKAGVLPEDLELAMLETQSRFRLSDDSKKIVVVDEDGDATDITPQDFFGKLYKQQRPKFYAASGAGGSGATQNSGGSAGKKTITRADFDKLPPPSQSAFVKGGGTVTD